MLQVLSGRQETIAEGKGIYHRTARANTIIKFSHQVEPRCGYYLSVSRKTAEGDLRAAWFVFDLDEAFVLEKIIEQSLMYICFGIPETVEHLSPRKTEPVVQPTTSPRLMVAGDSF